MKTSILLTFSALAFSQVPTYENYSYIEADGVEIQLAMGHTSPLVTDWDTDGDKDLILGRFKGGNLVFYRNDGTNEAPVLTCTGLMEAGGKVIDLPYG